MPEKMEKPEIYTYEDDFVSLKYYDADEMDAWLESEKRQAKKGHCELCGTPVNIVGRTTLHYEPIVPSVEEIASLLHRAGMLVYENKMLCAKAIHKLIGGE